MSKKTLKYLLQLLFLFSCMNSLYAAVMPDYVRLQPITTILNAPTAVALDGYENVYVTESSQNRLLIYSQSGSLIKQTTNLEVNKPMSIAVDSDGRIFIGNKDSRNVVVYSPGLTLLFKLGSGDGEFAQPNDIEIDSSGKIYVADSQADKIKIYNPDGTYATSFGSSGNGNGEFHKPLSIEIDETAGDIIVLDRQLAYDQYGSLVDGARIQIFDMNGVFKSGFTRYGQNVGLMYRPQHIAIDEEERIYVTDTFQNVALVYDKGGAYLGAVYDLANPLRTPLGITMGKSNRLFIASLNGRKVEIYGIVPYADMDVTPLSLSFEGRQYGDNPAPQIVEITNNGTEALEWTASATAGWITVSPASGVTAVSEITEFNIGADLAGLSIGTYTGSINISAPSGVTEVVNVILTVLSNPPIAAPGGPYTGVEGQALTLDGSNSSGNVILYEWDIDNDGTYDYASSSPTQSHIYAQQGSYYIRLKVTNISGYTDERLTIATISDTSPTADFTGNPTTGAVPLIVLFTNSSAGYDQPLTYEWDFDNDGVVDSTDRNPSYIYIIPGTYTVGLTVTDSDGSVSTLTKNNYMSVLADTDTDTIPEGDGTNPCRGGNTINCDDNCPDVYNPEQADSNGNGIGDACEPDAETAIDFSKAGAGSAARIYIEDNELPDISNTEFTIEVWIKKKTSGNLSGNIFSRLLGNGMSLYVKDNQPELSLLGAATFTASSGIEVTADVWTHLAGVLVNANHSSVHGACGGAEAQTPHMDIYVNGVFKGCATTNSQFAPGDQRDSNGNKQIWIGMVPEGHQIDGLSDTTRFDGIVDELRFWTVARTQDEIQQCMSRELGIVPPCSIDPSILKGYWTLNEGAGSFITDISGYGFSGIVESPSFIPWTGGWVTDSPFSSCQPPTITDTTVAGCLSELCKSDLSVSAYNQCGGDITYTWTPLNGGAIIGTVAGVQFDPPDSGPHPCPYQVELKVTSDATGLSTTRTVDIRVKLAGDANGDGIVNVLDKLLVRQHLGQLQGDPNWDARADVTCDGVVNVLDKLKVRQQLGRTDSCVCQ